MILKELLGFNGKTQESTGHVRGYKTIPTKES